MRVLAIMSALFLASAGVLLASLAQQTTGSMAVAGWIAFVILLFGACTGWLFECVAALPGLVIVGPALLLDRLRHSSQRDNT
jgi:hypothetical protein